MAGPKKLNPPFRADHVGSLLRPDRLLDARRKAGYGGIGEGKKGGKISDEELRDIENACIRDAVKLQEDVGLNVITDGELRRTSWSVDVNARIDGIDIRPGDEHYDITFKDDTFKPYIPYTVGKLGRRPGGLVLDDFAFLKPLTRRTVKMTVPAPTIMYHRGGRDIVSREAYPDLEDFFEDLSRVYREEIADLAKAGCTYVQIDNTDTALLCDPEIRVVAESHGLPADDEVSLHARLISGATKGRPDNIAVAMHLCRGNAAGKWMGEGGYDFVAEKLFGEFDVDAYFLEYDSERAGDFAPLRFAPHDRLIVLGLLTTKTPENDSRDALMRRIEAAAKFVPIECLALSPQCGFASVDRGNPITADDQRRKLELVVSVATEIWGHA